MLIVVMALATALTVTWFLLLGMACQEDWITAAYNQVLDNRTQADNVRRKARQRREKLAEYHGAAARVMGLFLGDTGEKELRRLERDNQRLQRGDLRSVSLFVIPGYVLQRRVEGIGRSGVYKKIVSQYTEIYGKKFAINKSKQLLAKLLSYPILGVALSLMLGTLLLGSGNASAGLAVMSVGTAAVLVLVYALYDEISDQVTKRREAISRQFPNVVSKLALLVTSGMIMSRAWRETAESQELELYQEMRRTAEELDNLVDPEAAYTNFINRCNTKETTKLASAIIQNQSKGNAEIGALLKEMAHEAWQERRHTAKRDSEKANSKLMIPTMLLFVTILVMLMVPVAMNFASL